ncbi:MAG: heme ABC transporter ATP-binding protein [Candidatus Methanofastidiosia archaeon]
MILTVRGIDFSYGKNKVLKNVSFTAESGQVLGIVGPNGSGKTTLLKCMRLVLPSKSGSISLGKTDISTWKRNDVAKYFGVVPQNSAINFPFSVFDIVLMGRIPHLSRFQSESENDLKVVREAMKLTSIEHLFSRSVSNLSGGESQRVIIARALAQQPKILLLDEPTSQLDINHQFEIMELVKDLAREQGMIVIVVSHNLNLSMRYCDKLLLLKEGEVFSLGDPEEVLTPENIEKVYGVEAEVDFHPKTRSYQITLIGASK